MIKIEINKSILEEFYKRHKNYLIPIATIVVCFILILEVTIPQISSLSDRQRQVQEEKSKLQILNDNFNIVSSLNDSNLDNELRLAVIALPVDKNFSGVINAVNIASGKAGVFLGDYEFQVGDLSKVTPGKGTPTLSLSLQISGGPEVVSRFLAEIYRTLPVSEVTNIQSTKTSSSVSLVFYYKPFSSVVNVTVPMKNLSKNYIDTLKNLSSWNNPVDIQYIINTSSSSAQLNPSSPF